LQKVSPKLALSAHFDFKDHLQRSQYNLRAWTFQEYHLANRLLIFAPDGQVYFSCKEAVFSEDVIPSKAFDSDVAMFNSAQLIKLRPDIDNRWGIYQRAVEDFTARRLSREQDILNAFAGFLRVMCPEPSVQGIPSPMFDLALIWQPRERLRRRAGFSSWSWAGWTGKIQWFDDRSLESYREPGNSESDQVISWTRWRRWIVWYGTYGVTSNQSTHLVNGPIWLAGSGPSTEAHNVRFTGQPSNFVPTESVLSHRQSDFRKPDSPVDYLQFWTISAYFDIELDRLAVLHWSSTKPASTGNGLRLFLLRDRYGNACGWILLDEGWVEKSVTKTLIRQEFILLSEGRSTHSYGQPSKPKAGDEENGFEEYNAMMIVWTEGIAERVGMGRVKKDAVQKSCSRDMKWKEIVLG
jgi:hypothetical protein